MNKSEKIEIINNLIMKAANLSYDPNGEPQYSGNAIVAATVFS